MSVLSGVTQAEQRALLSAAEAAHIGRVIWWKKVWRRRLGRE